MASRWDKRLLRWLQAPLTRKIERIVDRRVQSQYGGELQLERELLRIEALRRKLATVDGAERKCASSSTSDTRVTSMAAE